MKALEGGPRNLESEESKVKALEGGPRNLESKVKALEGGPRNLESKESKVKALEGGPRNLESGKTVNTAPDYMNVVAMLSFHLEVKGSHTPSHLSSA